MYISFFIVNMFYLSIRKKLHSNVMGFPKHFYARYTSRQFSFRLKILENICYLDPVPEARQAISSYLFTTFISDDISILFHNDQLWYCCNGVFLLQLSDTQRKVLLKYYITKQTFHYLMKSLGLKH